MNSKNIILTGLPRSGTTLVCHLLNKLPNTIALHEPMAVTKFEKINGSQKDVVRLIKNFFDGMRYFIEIEEMAISNHVDGKVPDNHIGNVKSNEGLRLSYASKGWIAIDKHVDRDFMLVIKHPSFFTAILDVLINEFPCYAVIRNPISVLASWNSAALPVNNGHVPAAENMDINLKNRLAEINDRFERQIYILHWFFNKFKTNLSTKNIIRYEEVVHTGGKVLMAINPHAEKLNETLENKNRNKLYNRSLMRQIGNLLLNTDGAYWDFYTKESVEEILRGL
ncbi:MAG: hypothetical protein QXG00_08815 [Candidatus Woesearchaeota archaeon]